MVLPFGTGHDEEFAQLMRVTKRRRELIQEKSRTAATAATSQTTLALSHDLLFGVKKGFMYADRCTLLFG